MSRSATTGAEARGASATAPGEPRPDGALGRRPLAALLVAFIALATAYNAVVPVFEAPDEHLHYFVVDHVARTGRLPVQVADPQARGPWEQEGSQPPLYYLLAAPLLRLAGGHLAPEDLRINHRNTMGDPLRLGNDNRFVHDPAREGWPWRGAALGAHLVRLLSTLLAALAVAATYGVARRVFAGPAATRDASALAVAALVAFDPQFLALAAAVTNDAAIVALAALALWLTARVLDGAAGRRTELALALVVGLAPLAKLSGLALGAFVAATLAWDGARRGDRRGAARRVAAIALAAALCSGWWYARNLALYGSLTGVNFMLVEGVGRDLSAARFLRGLPAELWGLWLSSWGVFGWFTVPLPRPAFAAIGLAAAAGAAGALAAVAARAPWLRRGRLGWLGLWWLLLFAALVRWLLLVKGAHGRLLFPAVAAPAVLLVAGWRALAERAAREWGRANALRLAAGVMALAGALAAYALLGVIRPAFAPPARLAAAEVPAAATAVDAVFDERVRLVAYRLPARATAGGVLPVTLYWSVAAPVARDAFVALRVDQTVAEPGGPTPGARRTVSADAALAYPGSGARPFDLMAPGPAVWVDRRALPLPPLAGAPGVPVAARLSIHVWDAATRAAWPVTRLGGAEAPAGTTDVGALFALDPPRGAAADPPAGPPVAHFGGLTLARRAVAGAVAPPRLAAAADGVSRTVPVVWRVDAPPSEELRLFVHLVDPSGAVVAQFDRPPATHGDYPTAMWRAGDALPADVIWAVPRGLAPGVTYRLRVGLYRATEGAPRVAARAPDGAPLPEDAATLLEVTVAEPVP